MRAAWRREEWSVQDGWKQRQRGRPTWSAKCVRQRWVRCSREEVDGRKRPHLLEDVSLGAGPGGDVGPADLQPVDDVGVLRAGSVCRVL